MCKWFWKHKYFASKSVLETKSKNHRLGFQNTFTSLTLAHDSVTGINDFTNCCSRNVNRSKHLV